MCASFQTRESHRTVVTPCGERSLNSEFFLTALSSISVRETGTIPEAVRVPLAEQHLEAGIGAKRIEVRILRGPILVKSAVCHHFFKTADGIFCTA